MSAISWAAVEAFASPASTSTASSGDDWIRSFQTAVARGLGESFYWPGSAASQGASAASGGELQLGTLRFAHAGSVGSGFPNGFLSLVTPFSGVYHIGSASTALLGHSAMLDAGSGISVGLPSTLWIMHEGQFVSSGTTTNVPFIPALLGTFTYGAPPLVFLSESTAGGNVASGAQFFAYGVHSVSSSNFTSVESALNSGTAGAACYCWRSLGTVSWTQGK